MEKIVFVCLGNICRSPMAEFVMKDLVEKAGNESKFLIESRATSSWEHGNPIHSGTQTKLKNKRLLLTFTKEVKKSVVKIFMNLIKLSQWMNPI